ncbi:hypothetical protein [Nodosilinea sp. E11]|uniref:hypothetical protein n=1 Tax=Nodosilinea sp. E11 TaxID=3037479 RepID=UPI0029344919|nr:hypothetical protein [Nodosilinea sp. E11]WOD41629.1 hypothetical protein RRF56_12575 [Nodosilinea sp. E11]
MLPSGLGGKVPRQAEAIAPLLHRKPQSGGLQAGIELGDRPSRVVRTTIDVGNRSPSL